MISRWRKYHWQATSSQTAQTLECFDSLFSSPKSLSISNTHISREDVKEIGKLLTNSTGNSPQLRNLLISFNTLTDCVQELLAEDSHNKLQVLGMRKTQLNQNDLRYFGNAVLSSALPDLIYLDLSENNLFEMEVDLENLILACTAKKMETCMKIYLIDNNLSESLITRVQTICRGTNVTVIFGENEEIPG